MDIKDLLKTKISEIVSELYGVSDVNFIIEHPDNKSHGDLSTNVAMVLTKMVKQPPLEIARNISYKLQEFELLQDFEGKKCKIFKKIDSLSPGFINLFLDEDWLKSVLLLSLADSRYYETSEILTKSELSGKRLITEYTDPNPFKVIHIGHLMSNAIGESLARLHAACGATVRRVNYQGDVGMHVSKGIWGLLNKMDEDNIELHTLESMPLDERVSFLGKCYAIGAKAFKDNPAAVEEMKDINYVVYIAAQEHLQETTGWVPLVDYSKYLENVSTLNVDRIKEIYIAGRQWSLDYFETLYSRLGTKFDDYYFESTVGEYGYKMVQEHLKDGVFEESEGAIVYRGEKDGLHTRVFVNSLGLPTYEAKDLGLAFMKNEDWPYDLSLIITANEINEYFKVVLKAMAAIQPDLAQKTHHIGHGMMILSSGKMSSRTGDVVSGDGLLNDVRATVLEQMKEQNRITDTTLRDEVADKVAVASVKYSVLKRNIGDDIVYDREAALSLTGNTGPYLLYTYARATSVLEKCGFDGLSLNEEHVSAYSPNASELDLLGELYKLPEIILEATLKLSPHLVATYTYEIAQKFNTFYADVSIANAETDAAKTFRLALTRGVASTIKSALDLLGIDVVQAM